MNICPSKLKNALRADFRLRYWIPMVGFGVFLAFYIINQSSPLEQNIILEYIRDVLPEILAAGAGAIVANYLNDYKDKSLKIMPHMVYPGVFSIFLVFIILIFSGVFTTVEIKICGNMYGQFSGEKIKVINKDLKKIKGRVKVILCQDYNKIAPQVKDASQSVNVTNVYSFLCNKLKGDDFRCDIFEIDGVWLSDFAQKNWIIPIDSYREKADNRYTFGIDHEVCKLKYPVDNPHSLKVFGVPNSVNVGFLMYRVDLFNKLIQKNSEPASWDELIEWLYEIREKYGSTYDGFVFQADQYEGLLCCYLEILWAMGGEIFIHNGIPRVYTPEGVKTLCLLKKLLADGIVPKEVLTFNEVMSMDHFIQGKTLVYRNWPMFFYRIQHDDTYRDLRNKVNVVSKPLPFRGVSASSAKMCLGGFVYAISKHAYDDGKAKLAMQVIEYLTSEEYFTENVFPSQYDPEKRAFSVNIPPNQMVLDNVRGYKDALDYSYLFLKNRNYRVRPKIAQYNQFSTILVKHIHQCLKYEKLSAEKALKNAQEEIMNTLYSKQ
ncbi:MAG: extracellular solute-binding protein [bacterium]